MSPYSDLGRVDSKDPDSKPWIKRLREPDLLMSTGIAIPSFLGSLQSSQGCFLMEN